MTVGRASTAVTARKWAAPGWPISRRIRARGSGLLANPVKLMAPRAAVAITV